MKNLKVLTLLMVALFVVSATYAQKPAFTDKVNSKYEISDEEALKNLHYESYDDMMYRMQTNPTDEHGNPIMLGNPTPDQMKKMEADIRAKEMSYPGWVPRNDAEAKMKLDQIEKEQKYREAGYWPIPEGFVMTGNEEVDRPNWTNLIDMEENIRTSAEDAGYKMIPGFKFTGKKAVDDANYAKAIADLKANDPVTYDKYFN